MSPINLTPQQVAEMLKLNQIVLIDVREPHEYLNERIAGALLFPLSSFDPFKLPPATSDRPLVFHCGAGGRSAKAIERCLQAGLPHNRHLAGGMGGWKAARQPYLKLDPATGQACEVC